MCLYLVKGKCVKWKNSEISWGYYLFSVKNEKILNVSIIRLEINEDLSVIFFGIFGDVNYRIFWGKKFLKL